jgi:uncharacterized membrane protein
MEWITLARAVHVLAIVVWIGGVAMVTMVIIPAIKRLKDPNEQMESFEAIEGRFAQIAKVATVVSVLSGVYLIIKLNAWHRYLDPSYWWMHAMTIIWFLFTVVLFILEPFVLHKLFKKYMAKNPAKTFTIMHRAHWILLILSCITILGAVAGSHGWRF